MLKSEMERELLRYLVSRQMFCAACKTVLAVDTAGSIEIKNEEGGTVYFRALCPKCYPRAKANTEAMIAEKAPHFESAEFYTVAGGTTTAKRDKATQISMFGGDA